MNDRIFILWLGDEEITEPRQYAIDSLPENKVLITKHNLANWVLDGFPLHPAYNYLSTIHKSDYLRCYLLYHYGGGYSDIKYNNINWGEAFSKIHQEKEITLMGVKTTQGHTIAGIEEWSKTTEENIRKNMDDLVVMGFFVCKAKTIIVEEWYNELNKRLDDFLPSLSKYPAKFTRECFHPDLGYALEKPIWETPNPDKKTLYPLSWNIILGQILYPIQLKYLKHIDNYTMKHDF